MWGNSLTQRALFRTNALDTPYRLGGLSPRAGWDATMDIGGWLRGLGLGQYEATFVRAKSTPKFCLS